LRFSVIRFGPLDPWCPGLAAPDAPDGRGFLEMQRPLLPLTLLSGRRRWNMTALLSGRQA